jgi:ligand-binding sensor domain-containing protein
MVDLMVWGLLLFQSSGATALSSDMHFHQFEMSQWSIKEGLPQVTVHALVQGPDHYLWAGTQAGLARFDGTRFELLAPDTHPALPSRLIRSLQVDSQQRLWIGTLRGAAWLKDGVLQAVPTETGRPVDILDMAETGDGWLLMATGSGLWRSRGDRLERPAGAPRDSLLTVYHRDGQT